MGQAFVVTLPAVVAGTPLNQPLGVIPTFEGTDNLDAKMNVTAPAAVTNPGGTNYASIAVRHQRAGVVQQTLGTLSLANTALVQDVPLAITITGATPSALQAGDELDVNVTHTGTGQTLVAGIVVEVEID